ncbi:LysR family transcriptional regulator [Caenimonas aquaedulcis]|uniref:LysR family transcriptional regulator n=1 Tax=Caenimonas aquaedulcis TaxID=2793270 RepID=A0A931MH10_9BURK|nr:LysR family transcriptional regulator [Caenimonas aquaedulcis]MBG9388324.1 LysR family transcriptional regulator [Caenimonas aquaedulcis]
MPHDITDLRFFVTITESGSLAEAARRLDVTASAVSQRLRHLEASLGMQLAHRSTRRFMLTEEGELFHAGVVEMLANLDGLVDRLRARSGEVVGTLHVGGPLGFGRHYLAPAIAQFHALHPKLMVSLTLSDVVSAADANRFDLIVHIGQLGDSSMVAYPIAPNSRFVCAAPSYLAKRPAPREPKDLAQHDCIVLRENGEDVTLWRFRRKRSEAAVRVPAILSSNDGEVAKQWALQGKGVVLRSEWDVADSLASGRLVRLLPGWSLPDADVVALVAGRTGMSARVKLFLSFLQARFQPAPPWRR